MQLQKRHKGTMWLPSRTFFGLLFITSASLLQALDAEKASVEGGANAFEPGSHLPSSLAPPLGQAIVDKFLTSNGGIMEGEERTGREVELGTSSTDSPQNSPSLKEGPII